MMKFCVLFVVLIFCSYGGNAEESTAYVASSAHPEESFVEDAERANKKITYRHIRNVAKCAGKDARKTLAWAAKRCGNRCTTKYSSKHCKAQHAKGMKIGGSLQKCKWKRSRRCGKVWKTKCRRNVRVCHRRRVRISWGRKRWRSSCKRVTRCHRHRTVQCRNHRRRVCTKAKNIAFEKAKKCSFRRSRRCGRVWKKRCGKRRICHRRRVRISWGRKRWRTRCHTKPYCHRYRTVKCKHHRRRVCKHH